MSSNLSADLPRTAGLAADQARSERCRCYLLSSVSELARDLPEEWKLRLRISSLGVGLGHLSSRVLNQQFPLYREIDAISFALVLRQLIRAIEALNRRVKSAEVDEALEEFYSKFPHEKEMRDILEHFDEYVIGEGRLQRDRARAGKAPDEYWLWYEADGMNYTLRLGANLRLNVSEVSEAAYQLSVAVREPFDRAIRKNKRA